MTETSIDWKQRAERAEAACAEMRKALLGLRGDEYGCFCIHKVTNDQCDAANNALSTDCGKGWVSPEVHKAELDRVKRESSAAPRAAIAEMYLKNDKLLKQLTLAVEALKLISSSVGCYCECNKPAELCDCAERHAYDTLAAIEKGEK